MADGHEGAREEAPAGEQVADQADGASQEAKPEDAKSEAEAEQ